MWVELIRGVSASVPANTMAVERYRGGARVESCFGNVHVPWPVEKGKITFAEAAWLEGSVVGALLEKAEEMGMGGGKRHDSPQQGVLGWK